MQQPQTETVTLSDIIITEELSRRNPRSANLLSENQALHALARQLVNQPETMIQRLVDIALELCNAQSAGVSLLETTPTGEEVFRPNVLAGALEQYVGGTTPRHFSPCGTCLDRGTPVLYSHPERYFTYLQAANTPIVEGLVLPLIADNYALGTIWILSYDEQRHFDSEDVRVMTSLADFTAAALLLNQRHTHQLLAKNAQLEALVKERQLAEESAQENEAYFRAIVNLVPDMLWRNDTTGDTSWYNQRWLDYTGQTLAEAQGYGWLEVIHPDDRAQSLANFQNSVDERRPLRQEHRIRDKDGNYRWFLVQTHPVFDADGRIIQWFGAAIDIHEQRVTLEALRESEERLRVMIENLPGGAAFVVDRDLRYLLAEGEALSAAGFKREDLVGHTIFEVLPSELVAKYEVLYRKALAGESFEYEHNAHDRSYISRGTPLRSPNGEVYAVLAVSYDISERKRAEEKLRRAAEMDAFRVKLSDALRSLTDPVQIQAEVCRLLGEHLSVDRTYYVEVNEAESYARVNQDYLRGDSPSLVGVFRLADYGWIVPYLQRGETIIVADAETADIVPAADRAAMTAIRIAAHISTPIIKAGALVGALCVTESAPRKWSEAEIELVSETAERIWATIQRTRAEAALHASEIQRIREQSAREEERQRAETLAELDRAKTMFFSNVSHEFRTPLTLLLAPLQDVLSDSVNPLTSSQRERLELAHRNAMRLLKLVNNLLDFSRIEAGRIEAVYKPTDLAMFTTELASVFRSAIERAGLRLIVDCPPLRSPVYVDRQMWEKIVLNLLSNAFKFTKDGEITVRLLTADDDHVMLQVEDTGTGIEPEELPHLFERFYQVRGTKGRTHEGSGIGLALVQELIRMHGGTVDVSSIVGQGSCFTVTIPLGTDHLPSDRIQATRTLTSTALSAASYVQEVERWIPEENGTREAEEVGEVREADSETISADAKAISANSKAISANSKAISADAKAISANSKTISADAKAISANSKTISANSKTISADAKAISANSKTISANSETITSSPDPTTHILILDDNADMRDYLKRILSEHVTVEAVADGAAALAAAQQRVPDLVLSDVMMPGLDGFELLKALRADERTKEIPIILLSARAGEESVVEGLLSGADDYLIKPFRATELVTRVLAHLQMAQLRSQALHHEKTINRLKDKFLAEVSHELNTPLVAILGWTRLLRSSPLNQSMLMKSLETIERNATLQAKLVQDLLDISRVTAGKISLNIEPVELQEVIENAIATVRQSLQSKDIQLECMLDPLPTTLEGDPDRLQQIVLNLLTNAVKFTPQGGRIEVHLHANKNQAQIVVNDNGKGISAEFLPYVFDTFRQASGSQGGLGLGLAIARHLVELHGGSILAESPGVGQGATFTVNLPLISVSL